MHCIAIFLAILKYPFFNAVRATKPSVYSVGIDFSVLCHEIASLNAAIVVLYSAF